MDTNTLIPVLAIATLIAGVAIGIWQFTRAKRAEKKNEHSAVSESRPELRADPHGKNPERVRPMSERVEPETTKVG